MRSPLLTPFRLALALIALGALLSPLLPQRGSLPASPVHAGTEDFRTAPVEQRPFRVAVRRPGTLKPVYEQRVFAAVEGTILFMAPQGSVVKEGDLVLKIDPQPHEDALAIQESTIRTLKAAYAKIEQEASKILNAAREDVASFNLLVELQQMRLDEVKRGPEETEIINAEVALKNAKMLLTAREEEAAILESLAKLGYASKEELRQKQLAVTEQRLSVEQADIRNRKIRIIDPVKVAEQELQLKDSQKARRVAEEKVKLLEQNMARDRDRFERTMERETTRQSELKDRVQRCMHYAPGPGLVTHKRSRYYMLVPGMLVYEGQEVIGLPDFSRMKVQLAVDEGRIGMVAAGQKAMVYPAGWNGAPFSGTVTKVAEKGHDEFELYQDETTDLTGRANRQVFDVEVTIAGQSPVLRIGLRSDVEIEIRTMEQALVVPRTAIVKERDGTLVVRTGDAQDRRPVKVLAENELYAAIEGVNAGDRVWITGVR